MSVYVYKYNMHVSFFFFFKKNTTKKLCVRHTSPSGATKLHPNAVQELNEVKQIN
jgi:hypothetical protein